MDQRIGSVGYSALVHVPFEKVASASFSVGVMVVVFAVLGLAFGVFYGTEAFPASSKYGAGVVRVVSV